MLILELLINDTRPDLYNKIVRKTPFPTEIQIPVNDKIKLNNNTKQIDMISNKKTNGLFSC